MFYIRCTSRSIRLATQPAVSYPRALLVQRRRYANQSQSSPTRYEPDIDPSADNVQNEFAGHAMSAFKDMRKVVLFLAYGSLIVGTVTGVIFEATHFWIERKMCERADDDAQRWGWEVRSWSDVETGGTSRELGIMGRHAVRAAWFSLRYSKYFTTNSTISQVEGGAADQGSLNIVDAGLESARVYLEKAMTMVRDDQERVRMNSVGLELLEHHAAVMERLGTRVALAKARDEYTQVLHGRTGQRLVEARLAVKLGDLSERLGDSQGALSWWMRGIDLTKDETPALSTSSAVQSTPSPNSRLNATHSRLPGTQNDQSTQGDTITMLASLTSSLPVQPPSIPAAQRTLVAAMLSLSAYCSRRRQLPEALNLQERAIRLIDAMVPQHEASSSGPRVEHSPGQILHYMYLLHRKSLLGIHHGEVVFALAPTIKAGTSPHKTALMDLLIAASSSEVVAQILTGLSLSHPDLPSSYPSPKTSMASTTEPSQRIPHPPSANSSLLPIFQDSPALSVPAGSLLRDARLAAAEAWDLCGVLYSELGGANEDVKALECFERALAWVGEDPAESGSREGIGMKEWQALWARFVEAREKVLRQPR